MMRVHSQVPGARHDVEDREGRDDEGSGIEFRRHLDDASQTKRADKPRVEQRPAPKKPVQHDDTAQPEDAADAPTAPEPPRSFTDLGAAITRALAALRGADGPQPSSATGAQADVGQSAARVDDHAPDTVLTPLEQAVHDIMAALPQPKSPPDHDGDTEAETVDETAKSDATPAPIIAVDPAPQKDAPVARPTAQPAPVAEPRATETPASASHMHLVVGDDDDRVVVTIAVRGQDVNVSMRGGDDQTAANLARNAASLDHAMRARGLDLASFSHEPDPDHHARRDRPDRERQRDDAAEPFVLEDKS